MTQPLDKRERRMVYRGLADQFAVCFAVGVALGQLYKHSWLSGALCLFVAVLVYVGMRRRG